MAQWGYLLDHMREFKRVLAEGGVWSDIKMSDRVAVNAGRVGLQVTRLSAAELTLPLVDQSRGKALNHCAHATAGAGRKPGKTQRGLSKQRRVMHAIRIYLNAHTYMQVRSRSVSVRWLPWHDTINDITVPQR
jgi:hypothetical protein